MSKKVEELKESFFNGVSSSLSSSLIVLQEREVISFILKICGITLFLVILTHFLAFIILLPFKIVFTIFHILLFKFISFPYGIVSLLSFLPYFIDTTSTSPSASNSHELDQNDWSLELAKFIARFTSTFPLILLFFLRYVYWKPLDDLFKKGLSLCNEEASKKIYMLEGRQTNLVDNLLNLTKRYLKRLGVLIVLLLLSFTPIFGRLVFPLAQFYLTVKSLGFKAAAALFVASMLPFVNPYSRLLFEHWQYCQLLSLELLEPFIMRANLTPKQSREMFQKHSALLLGFMTPFTMFISAPFIGPICFTIAQASMPFLLYQYILPDYSQIFM